MPSANLAPVPKLQFFDANGNPLVGGKLFSYAAGTTTPLATYTDSSGSTPNTNPVILDSRGEASVWLGSALYKFALQNAAGVPIWTVDNVATFATLADLAASGGSALVGFLQSGTGAEARTVQSKLRDVYSFDDFGADGNDSTDDTTDLQQAIDAVAALGGGRLMGRPGATYKITSALTLKSGVQIDLAGATIKQYTNNTQIFTAPSGTDINGWALTNGTLRYNTVQDGTATISVTVTGTLTAGDIFTGLTSGATGKVVSVSSGVLTYLAGVGSLVNGESLSVNNQTQATTTSTVTTSKLGRALRLANGAFSYNFLVDHITILDAYDGILCPTNSGSFAFVGRISNYIASVCRWAVNYDCDSATGANTNVVFENCWHNHSMVPRAPFASGFFFNACAMFRWDSVLADKIEGQFLFIQTSSGEVGTISLEAANLIATSNLQASAVQLSDSSVSIGTVKFVGNTFKTYNTITVTITGTIAVGNIITGGTSGAIGKVVSVAGSRVTFTQNTINANFQNGEQVRVGGVSQGTISAAVANNGQLYLLRATSATQNNQYSAIVDNFVTSGNTYEGQEIYDVGPTANSVSSGPFEIYNTQATLDRAGAGFTITGTIAVGNTITGATSGASGVVTAVGTFLVQYKPTNFITWTVGENVQVGGVTQATALGNNIIPGYLADFATPPSIKLWNGINRDAQPDPFYAESAGYVGLPQNAKSAAYTLVLSDAGKSIVHPITDNNARTFTIPANSAVPFPVGTAITFVNMINTVTIAITTDTMYLAGPGTTGSRTLAAYGVATAIKVTSTSWIISGNGLS